MKPPAFGYWITLMGLGGFLYAVFGVAHVFTGESFLSIVGATLIAGVGLGVPAAIIGAIGRYVLGGDDAAPAPAAPTRLGDCGAWPVLPSVPAPAKRPALLVVRPSELYGLRLFQLVELARDLSESNAATSDAALAAMFSQANAPRHLRPSMATLAVQTRNLQTVLAELRTRTDAWLAANVEIR